MYLCFYVPIYLCIYVSMYLCIYVSMYPHVYVSIYLCIYLCTYVCIHKQAQASGINKTCPFFFIHTYLLFIHQERTRHVVFGHTRLLFHLLSCLYIHISCLYILCIHISFVFIYTYLLFHVLSCLYIHTSLFIHTYTWRQTAAALHTCYNHTCYKADTCFLFGIG